MFHSSCVVIMSVLLVMESAVESSLSAMHMDEHA